MSTWRRTGCRTVVRWSRWPRYCMRLSPTDWQRFNMSVITVGINRGDRSADRCAMHWSVVTGISHAVFMSTLAVKCFDFSHSWRRACTCAPARCPLCAQPSCLTRVRTLASSVERLCHVNNVSRAYCIIQNVAEKDGGNPKPQGVSRENNNHTVHRAAGLKPVQHIRDMIPIKLIKSLKTTDRTNTCVQPHLARKTSATEPVKD